MDHAFEHYKRTFQDIGPIVFRNVVLITNVIIYLVIIMLFIYHETQVAFFLLIAIVVAIVIGLVQDIRARLMLEKLQMLTALRVARVNQNGTEESVLAEEIKKGDRVKLKLGDQVPCDGTLISSEGIEVSNALLTGESNSMLRLTGEKVQAGGIVTAGKGMVKVETPFADSRISQITKHIKKYTWNFSPIQISINRAIKYSGYLLIFVLGFIIGRGILVHQPVVSVVKNVAALTSLLVPQGLVLVTTILFAYGAVNLFRKHVLLQEINATEKLGRIKNLCLDKTGTLTEIKLVVEKMLVPDWIQKTEAEELTKAYLNGSNDSTESVQALTKFFTFKRVANTNEYVPFSSQRRFGAVTAKNAGGDVSVIVGADDVVLPHLADEKDKLWLQQTLKDNTSGGKRILCVVKTRTYGLPKDLIKTKLLLVAVFIFYNNLREGIRDVIDFFQKRGVIIRIISGDNPETVSAVALSAGVKNSEAIILGQEMESWTQEEYNAKAGNYHIFARINPEQKEKIITALKKIGFTAMVGDGANDALAIKKADLGIAMFDGAQATRRLAAVVLTNNSFLALPGGVKLADNIIGNIEIMASLFFNQVASGLFFFIILSVLNHTFPLTPLNITLIDYFGIGFPSMMVFYWAVYATEKPRLPSVQPFLRRVLPFAVVSGFFQAIVAAIIFFQSTAYLKTGGSNSNVIFAFIVFNTIFFIFAPSVYIGMTTRAQKIMFAGFCVCAVILLYFIFQVPLMLDFFDLNYTAGINITSFLIVIFSYCAVQFGIVKWFWLKARQIRHT
ncbi:MAG: HAD-IC family P-type ATPase [Candidatus Doudnabacteria bacterium]